LSWTLFNGFAREQQQVSAAVSRDVAKARADDTRRQVNASLTQQIAAVTTAFAKLDITASTVAAASEDLRVQQERYRVGAATILDLLTSQANLTQAQQNQVQARFDYLIARAQLEALVGRTL
jgi:outer membrane protein TolC